jgi:hyperosmotically inducible periplasmic protein
MFTTPAWHPFARRHRRRWVLALLAVAAGVAAAIGYAKGLDLPDVTRTFSTVRESTRDAALVAKVKSALALSRRVSGFRIGVSAHADTVSLEGRVPSPEARSIVEAIAADTPGVVDVRDDLVVDPRAVANGYETTLLGRISDLETQVAIQERLRREPLLAGATLSVEVDHGMVVLHGTVNDEIERASARKIAQAAVGADQVRDDLQIANPGSETQDRLARRVEFELYSSGAFDLARLQVTSEAGDVHLAGSVRSEAERLLAARLAEGIPGVRRVVNQLSVATGSS